MEVSHTMTKKKNNKNSTNPSAKKSKKTQKKKNSQARKQTMQALSTPAPQPTLGSVGGQLGTIAGNFLSKIFGLGAYAMDKNTVYSGMCGDQVPVMHRMSDGFRFQHREYIADVSSSTTFTTTTYQINPGLSTTFPFLSAIAQNFQEYSFEGLVFEFKSTSATALNSTNTALGTVALCAQYRSDAVAFSDKQQLLNEMWAVDAKPSESFILPIECAPKENPFAVQYVRGAAVPSGQDTKMYDLAKLTVGTVGSQATAVVGELWASYDVILRKPQLSAGLDLYGLGAHYEATTGVSLSNYFGTSQVLKYDSMGLSFGASTVTFPLGLQGYFGFAMLYVGSTATVTVPNITWTNATAQIVSASSGDTLFTVPANTTSTRLPIYGAFYTSTPNLQVVMTLSGGGLPATISNFVFQVFQLPGSYV
jgi:hypothetical protein